MNNSAFTIEEPPAPAPQGAAPRVPTGGRTLEEVVLPSGRCVRLRRLATSEYLDAKQRAASAAGTAPDPKGVRFSACLDRELLALCVVAYTEVQDFAAALAEQTSAQLAAFQAAGAGAPNETRPAFEFVPDAGGLLESVSRDSWRPTTPLELLTSATDGLLTVFSEVVDWEVLTAVAGRLMLPTRNLSGIAGKGRTVVR